MTEQITTPPDRRHSGGQVAAMVAGGIAGVLAVIALVAGGVALWGDSHKDRDGYLATGSDPYATRTYAIATDSLDVDGDVPGVVQDLAGKLRLRVSPHGDKPVFVGVAPTSEVSRYLGRSAHATVTDLEYDPFKATYRIEGGERRPAAPADQGFWAASASGSGTQSLTWDVKRGSWSVVVMNADGSAGVDAGVSAGFKAAWLEPAGWGALGGGALLALVSGGLLFFGLRRPTQPPAVDQRRSASSVITAS